VSEPKQPWHCQKCSCTGITIPRATPRSKICAWCAQELAKAGLRWCAKGRHASADWTPSNATMCRACQHAQNQAYRAAHRATLIAQSKAHWETHRAERMAASRAYYQEKRDQLLEKKRAYYRANRARIIAQTRTYRRTVSAAAREKARQRHRMKHAVYYQNYKLAQRRRWLASLRGAR